VELNDSRLTGLRRLSRGANRAVTDHHCLEALCFV
jgi:hypothetical protein